MEFKRLLLEIFMVLMLILLFVVTVYNLNFIGFFSTESIIGRLISGLVALFNLISLKFILIYILLILIVIASVIIIMTVRKKKKE